MLVTNFYIDYVELKVVWKYCNPNIGHLPIKYLFGPLKKGVFTAVLTINQLNISLTLLSLSSFLFWRLPSSFIPNRTIIFMQRTHFIVPARTIPHRCALSDGLVRNYCIMWRLFFYLFTLSRVVVNLERVKLLMIIRSITLHLTASGRWALGKSHRLHFNQSKVNQTCFFLSLSLSLI